MPAAPITDRGDLAERRLRKVLKAQTVASSRTLEQKISDAGPSQMRINPHILTEARQRLEAAGVIAFRKMGAMRWYHLADATPSDVDKRLELLVPIHAAMQKADFGKRLGQTLEIAIYRALLAQPQLNTLGGFLDLDTHDDGQLYSKEEPPSTISGRRCTGRLDFIVTTNTGLLAGIEVKNVREWMYPDRADVRDLLKKCTTLDIVPVLIARRIPYVTFKLLNATGAIIHQTYNQLFPQADAQLAGMVRDKNLLGYHDVRLGNEPDARLTKFTTRDLPLLVAAQRPVFDEYKDLLKAFSTGEMPYKEFAARVRRRVNGTNEDADWDE